MVPFGFRQPFSGALSPGEVVTISGTAIGPNDTATGAVDSATNRWMTTVGGVQVTFNGIAGPVLYSSATQVSAVVPYEVAGRLDCFVVVRYRGNGSNAVDLPVTSSAPGVYTQNLSGTGPGVIYNQDGTLNSPGNPAAKNSVIVIYGTGEGLGRNLSGASPQTGQVIPIGNVADDPRPILPVAVQIDGQPSSLYANFFGSVPGTIAGVWQTNVIVPPTAGSGNVPVVVSVGSNSSQTGVTVAIR